MRPLLRELWLDESGSLLVTDWPFVATILMLAILCATVAVRSRMQPVVGDESSGTFPTGTQAISTMSSCSNGVVD